MSSLCQPLIDFKVQMKTFWLNFALNLLLPNSRISNNFSSFSVGRKLSMYCKSMIRFAQITLSKCQRTKIHCCFRLHTAAYKRFKMSSKSCIRFCSRKWLRPCPEYWRFNSLKFKWNLLGHFWNLDKKWNCAFWGTSLVQSFMRHEKEEFLKYSVLQGKAVNQLGFLKECLIGGINL